MTLARGRPRTAGSDTRDRLLQSAVALYGSRGIGAVSLREISVAAGQKNPNALQYHFGSREGLLQAIVDHHATAIGARREAYFERAASGEWPPAEAVAQCLVMPIVDYLIENEEGLNFVRIVSQLRTLAAAGESGAPAVVFPRADGLRALLEAALGELPRGEAQLRINLVVNTAFHAIGEIFQGSEAVSLQQPLSSRMAMVEQLLCMLTLFFAAPSQQGK